MNLLPNIIHIFTDGACRGNGSSYSLGASAFILYLNGREKESVNVESQTTNNSEELYAILLALQTLKRYDLPVIVYSDSKYAINSITVWMKKWKQNGFKTSENKPVKNKDLMIYLDEIVSDFKNIRFEYVKGHSDNEYNNRCDELCNQAMDEYEQRMKPITDKFREGLRKQALDRGEETW